MLSKSLTDYASSVHEAILESLPDAIVTLDAAGRVDLCNRAAAVLFARSKDQVCGQPVACFLRLPASATDCRDATAAPAATAGRQELTGYQVGERTLMLVADANHGEREVEVTVAELVGSADRHCLIIKDRSEPMHAAKQAARRCVLERVVARATTQLVASHSLNDAMTDALEAIGDVLDVAHAFVFRIRTFGGAQKVSAVARWQSQQVAAESRGLLAVEWFDQAAIRAELEAGRAVVVEDVETEDNPVAKHLRQQVRSAILVPIRVANQVDGVLAFDETRLMRPWTADERVVLRDLAEVLARAMERVRDQWSLAEARQRSREALLRAEAASDAKSEFLASVSHELRTPLTAIVGYADLAGRASTSPEERIRMCQRIQHSADFLLGLINDVLDLSKIESRQMEVALRQVDLGQLLDDVITSLEWIARDKGIQLLVRCANSVPSQIVSDPTRLRQILINLVSNGLKFTARGAVTVHVGFEARCDGRQGSLLIVVRDTGIGIAADKLRDLFQRFTQVHVDRKYGGTGLGLAISRHLARLLGGDVDVVSQLGHGSSFTLTLPVTVRDAACLNALNNQTLPANGVAARAALAPPSQILTGARVLLVDDNEDNRQIFELVLKQAGATVRSAHEGRQALHALQAAEAVGEAFSLVLLDMDMPVLDGYETMRVYRGQGGKVPVVALTAFALASDRDKCLAVGCDGYMSKPIRPEELLREAAKHIGGTVPCRTDAVLEQSDLTDLLVEFQRVAPARVAKLQLSFARGERERVRAQLHQLKGSAGCYGLAKLAAVAARGEDALRSGLPLAAIARDLQELARLVGTDTGAGS